MAGFIRRYLSDPGLEELLAIEGVVILDRTPPGAVTGSGSGVVGIVGEFEDGPFDTPIEVTSGQDLATQFGGFGFAYDGVVANNPCARGRKSDGAVADEAWNGNAAIALANKVFRRLVCTRVDTTVGEVTLTRLPYLDGNALPTWSLSPGQVLSLLIGGVADTVTFDAAVATRDSAAGVYPTTFVGGESATLTIDEGTPNQIGPVEVVFTSADQAHAAVVARINAALGYTGASIQAGNVTRVVGRVAGTSGSVRFSNVGTLVGTALGVSAGVTSGTGDVADITAVTFTEAAALIDADTVAVRAERSESGAIRLVHESTAGTAAIEVVSASTTATAFGFPLDVEATAASVAAAGVIPAGTRVRTAAGVEWVTAQSVAVEASDVSVNVRVRPATDNGTNAGALPAAVTVVPYPIAGLGSWHVTNTSALDAALSESAIDAAYGAALDATLNPNSAAKEINIMISARQSSSVSQALRANAIAASSSGLRGRCAIVRPPLGTTRTIARGSSNVGVGATRNQRVWYAYPGGATQIRAIATRGVSGGAGFTSDGIVDVGSDAWLASVCSQLPPEENPGQLTEFTSLLLGVERGNADVQALTETDYRAFRAAGICALRMDEGTAIFQSGVTSVDPATSPELRNIARRRMADFIQDSIALRLRSYTKKLSTRVRRSLVLGEIDGFLAGLLSDANSDSQRIDSYLIDAVSPNTPASLAAGLFRVKIKARTLASLDVIVLDTEIGENVLTVAEAA